MTEALKSDDTTRPEITISLSNDELDLFQAWAGNQGKSLSGWAREILLAALPADAVKKRLGREVPKDLGRAKQPEPDGEAMTLENAPRVPEHPCVFLRRIFPGHLGPNQCRGTCASPKTAGKPCHWSASQADQCPYFAARYFDGQR